MPSEAELRVRKSDRPIDDAATFVAAKTVAAVDRVGVAMDTTIEKAGDAIGSVQKQGGEAADSAGEVVTNIRNAIDKSAKTQPTTTVLLALGAGFLLGAVWKSGR